MKCTAMNGYAGWKVREESSGDMIENVLWIDPDLLIYCAADQPIRIVGSGEIARTVHAVQDIRVDLPAHTFWIKRAPLMVAPLSPGRQDQQPTDKPCTECCQEETCRRLDYCAAHRGPFGRPAP